MNLSIFVSSTCFDLRALREHLRSQIKALGHEPLLSEFDSFPVSPDINAVENCRKVVRESADILCLIIGGRRGHVDQTGKSVVNLEYLEAKLKGIDCLIFVDSKVWNIHALYKKNPTADFSAYVDSIEIFTFLEELKQKNKWIFQFDRTEEILSIISRQLSVRFKDLLSRARAGKIDIPSAFIGEPHDVIDLLTLRPKFWEFLLTSKLLRNRLLTISSRFSDLNRGLIIKRSRHLSQKESFSYIQSLISDFTAMLEIFPKIMSDEIQKGWAPPGTPGDPVLIKKGCESLYTLGLSL